MSKNTLPFSVFIAAAVGCLVVFRDPFGRVETVDAAAWRDGGRLCARPRQRRCPPPLGGAAGVAQRHYTPAVGLEVRCAPRALTLDGMR